jgi:hypothetical protein
VLRVDSAKYPNSDFDLLFKAPTTTYYRVPKFRFFNNPYIPIVVFSQKAGFSHFLNSRLRWNDNKALNI